MCGTHDLGAGVGQVGRLAGLSTMQHRGVIRTNRNRNLVFSARSRDVAQAIPTALLSTRRTLDGMHVGWECRARVRRARDVSLRQPWKRATGVRPQPQHQHQCSRHHGRPYANKWGAFDAPALVRSTLGCHTCHGCHVPERACSWQQVPIRRSLSL